MAGGKETPRQKMIGMMYLVLTALLALNVSKEIINAFVKLDSKLQESNRVFISKSESLMAEFDKCRAMEKISGVPENRSQVLFWQKRADEIRKLTWEMDKFINLDCKNKMLSALEGKDFIIADEQQMQFRNINLMEVENKDDYDIATRLFGGEKGTEGYAFGAEIRNKIQAYRDQLLSITADYLSGKQYGFDPSDVTDAASLEKELSEHVFADDRDKIRTIYNTLTVQEKIKEFEEEVDWQLGMFDHAPVVAAAALFTAISNDIRSAEAQALEIITSRIKTPPFYFNKIEPLAFAPTSYLNVGDSMDVNVMIAAYDSTEKHKIRFALNDSLSESFKEHNGKISVHASAPGVYTLYGEIAVKERNTEKWKPWSYQYEVGQPQGTVANEDFTIVYAGFPHTFSASASGFPQEGVSLNIAGATVTPGGNGKFTVKAQANQVGQLLRSSVVVKTGQGTKILQGPSFLVKKLPKPEVYFGTIPATVTEVTKNQLISNMNVGIRAAYDQSVPFNPALIQFSVGGFSMTVIADGNRVPPQTSGSGQVTLNMQNMIRALRPGMFVSFSGIKANGPTGSMSTNNMTFKIIP